MRRFLLPFLALFVAAQALAEGFTQGVLWKVEKNQVAPSYLFGTVHVSDPRVAELPAPVERAFNDAKSFTTEMVVDDSAQAHFVRAMRLQHGKLCALLEAQLCAEAIQKMQERGFPPDVAERLKPWGILVTLIVPPPTGEPILDQRMQQLALKQKKPLYELESVEEQVAVFDDMPLELQVAMLKSAVEHYDDLPELVEQTVQHYLKRDLAALWELNAVYAKEGQEQYDDFAERVLFSRNIRMAQRLEQRLQEGGAFVAVGALHLFGDKGLPALLEKKGYRVSRVY